MIFKIIDAVGFFASAFCCISSHHNGNSDAFLGWLAASIYSLSNALSRYLATKEIEIVEIHEVI